MLNNLLKTGLLSIMIAATASVQAQQPTLGTPNTAAGSTVERRADNSMVFTLGRERVRERFPLSSSAGNSDRYIPRAAIKTNLLYLATTTPNVAVEFGLAPKWTLDLAAGLNPWDLNDRKGGIRHGLVQPELRYWFCERFEQHFIGLHGIYGQYEMADIDLSPIVDITAKRYNGWAAGAGISYGYHLPAGKRWAWEFTVGVGYLHLDYDRYTCGACSQLIGNEKQHYFGPTKAAVSLIFMIR